MESYRRACQRKIVCIKVKKMPQLIPFYFVNQLVFSFITLFLLIYIFSKYILPLFTLQQVIRTYITKLSTHVGPHSS